MFYILDSDDRKRSQKKVRYIKCQHQGLLLGLVQATALILGSRLLPSVMGVKHASLNAQTVLCLSGFLFAGSTRELNY